MLQTAKPAAGLTGLLKLVLKLLLAACTGVAVGIERREGPRSTIEWRLARPPPSGRWKLYTGVPEALFCSHLHRQGFKARP